MSKNQNELRNQQTDRKPTQSPKEEGNKQNVANRKDDDRKNTKEDSHKESTNERERNPAAPNTKDRK
jgi:hypothetical protein